MVAYAKEVSITLYTHNDERDILSLPLLQQALKRAMKEVEGWGHSWYHMITLTTIT